MHHEPLDLTVYRWLLEEGKVERLRSPLSPNEARDLRREYNAWAHRKAAAAWKEASTVTKEQFQGVLALLGNPPGAG